MFARIARFASRYKILILLGWAAITVIFGLFAPSLSKVGVTDQSEFLPKKTQSSVVQQLLDSKFAGGTEAEGSSAIIVTYNPQGLEQQNLDDAKTLRTWMTSGNGPGAINSVISIFDSDALKSSLVSKDNTTMMMTVEFSTTEMDESTTQAVNQIRDQFKVHPDTTFYLTGNVGFIQDLYDSAQRTIDRSTYVTIALVIILLLIIYRSPIAVIVPLMSIGFSFLVARGIIGYMAQAGVPVSTVTDALLVVTIFGVGTDYCLFIISRFREELMAENRTQHIQNTMTRIGPIIFASAITVIIAFLCLSVSEFGMTRTSGWALALGIGVTLVAGITLVPALMSLFGRYLFWPFMKPPAPSTKKRRWSWAKTGELVSRHPLWFVIPILVLLVLPYIALPKFTLSANILTQLPKNTDSTRGLTAIKDHFPMGELSPLILLIQSKDGSSLMTDEALGKLRQTANTLSTNTYFARIDYYSAPSEELAGASAQVKSLADAVGPAMIPETFAPLQTIGDNLQALALRYPGIMQSDAFEAASGAIMQSSGILQKLPSTPPQQAAAMLPELKNQLNNLAGSLATLGNEFMLQGDNRFVQWLKANYFSVDGTIARMNLEVKIDPYSDAASEAVPDIRNQVDHAVSSSGLSNENYYVGGETALYTDMLQTSNDDFTIVIIVTSIGILAVIIILLRCLIAPLYMVITVLFNFGATLGITAWVLQSLFKFENLIMLLPVFVFVMLAAVGADYNIFLVSRIREEAETKPIKEAVQNAVAHTGNVITSCGIILAGTFATLAITDFPMVLEIGVAIAIGVLIDTFLVRALLVPALAALFGRWSWWPSALYRKK